MVGRSTATGHHVKHSKEQRDAYKAAIDAAFALVCTLDRGAAKKRATRVCDELLALRYGPISQAPAGKGTAAIS
jgi:hypothetical protein